jgi:hypothetical protein
MTDPFAGIITQAFKDIHKYAIDALLEDDALTIPCRITYADNKQSDCPNCIYDSQRRRSANRYQPGGPTPFQYGTICPYCSGHGRISSEQSEEIYLAVIWDYRYWIDFDLNVQSPEGRVQTISKIDTLPSLKRAKYVTIGTDIENYVKHRFQRDSEVQPCGLGANNYCVVLWKRVS